MVYVSHRLDEVFALADRVTVLRDGRRVGTTRRDELDEPSLVSLMAAAWRWPRARTGIRTQRHDGLLAVEGLHGTVPV